MEYNANLIIQKLSDTEGTKKFTKFQLKQSKKLVIQTETTQISQETSQINIYDTRGQILMDDKEIQQVDFIMQVIFLFRSRSIKIFRGKLKI